MQSANYSSPLTIQGNSNGEPVPVTTVPPTGTDSTTVQGTAAHDATPVGNPVLVAGYHTGGATVKRLTVANAGDPVTANSPALINGLVGSGSTVELIRSVGIGNGVAAAGIAASGAYGSYLTNANQYALTTGQYGVAQFDSAGNLRTAPQRPTATDILAGTLAHTSTTAATTIVTVAAGRTWVGTVTISCDVAVAAASATAGQALGVVTTAGTNVVPAAGTYLACEARAGANAATGTVGSQGHNQNSIEMTVVAPAGNAVTIQGTTTIAGTAGRVDFAAFGVMQ